MRRRLEGRFCRHDASLDSAGELREVTDPRQAPGSDHPFVRTHPVTGRRALFLASAYILGLELDDSEALLDARWHQASRRELTRHQQWRVGDLLWDNRCVLHRRDEFALASRRLMRRGRSRATGRFEPQPILSSAASARPSVAGL
jgi:taurine dioxygenase